MMTECNIVSHCGAICELLSDDYPVYAVRKKPREVLIRTTIIGRSYRHYSKDEMYTELAQRSWVDFNATSDPELQWQLMQGFILEYLDRVCPSKSIVIKKKRDTWINRETVELINDR